MQREDMIKHPNHYMWFKELTGIEPIDVIRHLNFDIGAAIKYLLRVGKKKEEGMSDIDKAIEDLEKAKFYIDDYINNILKKHGDGLPSEN